ncbi:MAG: hypothetical protein WDZ83_03865 [Rhizobiaceae bacterium]
MSLDFAGFTVLTTVAIFNIYALISALDAGRNAKLTVAICTALWVGVQIALANAGAFSGEFGLVFPLVGLMVVLPPLLVLLMALISTQVREVLVALPQPLLIGLNAARVFGFFFLLLAWDGRLGGPFPQSAGWGDVVTGILAVPLAVFAARGIGRRAVPYWNAFGAADLIAAVALGTLSFNGFVLQMIEQGAGSDAVLGLPWSIIPTVLVPFYLITHGIIFAQSRQWRTAAA